MKLTEEQVHMITLALRVVEEEYRSTATKLSSPLMREGFHRDADKYADLAITIENPSSQWSDGL